MSRLLKQMKQEQDAARAEVAAAKAEAAIAHGQVATCATRVQELQDSAAIASQVSYVHLPMFPMCSHMPLCYRMCLALCLCQHARPGPGV